MATTTHTAPRGVVFAAFVSSNAVVGSLSSLPFPSLLFHTIQPEKEEEVLVMAMFRERTSWSTSLCPCSGSMRKSLSALRVFGASVYLSRSSEPLSTARTRLSSPLGRDDYYLFLSFAHSPRLFLSFWRCLPQTEPTRPKKLKKKWWFQLVRAGTAQPSLKVLFRAVRLLHTLLSWDVTDKYSDSSSLSQRNVYGIILVTSLWVLVCILGEPQERKPHHGCGSCA